MAEENGEKTEAPTPRRRQQAEEQGNVPRSQDLVAAALVVGSMLLLNSFGSGVIHALRTLLNEMLSSESLTDFSVDDATRALLRSISLAAQAMAPLLVGVMLIACITNLLQVGFRLNLNKLQPNLAALNPLGGLGRLVSGRSPVKGAMSLVKFLIICVIAYYAIRDRLAQIVTAQGLDFVQVFGMGASVVYAVALRIGIALLVLAILDYAYQRYRIEQDLKMSKQEVKEDMRSMDGDPKMKMRRRQVAMQIASGKLKKQVPTADVIVTNPTEFAVALKYDPDSMAAPRVVAKGQGFIAARIRQIAIANGIPIIERKPLARALFKLVEVGHEVPEQFYGAIAEILAYVYELSGKNVMRKTG